MSEQIFKTSHRSSPPGFSRSFMEPEVDNLSCRTVSTGGSQSPFIRYPAASHNINCDEERKSTKMVRCIKQYRTRCTMIIVSLILVSTVVALVLYGHNVAERLEQLKGHVSKVSSVQEAISADHAIVLKKVNLQQEFDQLRAENHQLAVRLSIKDTEVDRMNNTLMNVIAELEITKEENRHIQEQLRMRVEEDVKIQRDIEQLNKTLSQQSVEIDRLNKQNPELISSQLADINKRLATSGVEFQRTNASLLSIIADHARFKNDQSETRQRLVQLDNEQQAMKRSFNQTSGAKPMKSGADSNKLMTSFSLYLYCLLPFIVTLMYENN